MEWIALLPSHEADRTAWGWRALRFTPRVAWVDEALLLEVGASERLFGGRKRLLRALLKGEAELSYLQWGSGPTGLVALARLRSTVIPAKAGIQGSDDADTLPLATLTAATGHLATLERVGCTTWGELRRLPRAGVSRRFGAGLLQALDTAYGERPERYEWIALPQSFDQKLELPALATAAPELLAAAQRLLTQLQMWLAARNLGVLALELEWTLDLRRIDGRPLPPNEALVLRTAEPTQDMRHVRRLAAEQLARTAIAAPANALRLRTLETVPWGGLSTSLLPEDNRPGEKLHQLIERLSVRLGRDSVVAPVLQEDHRPERMQVFRKLPLPSAEKGVRGTGAEPFYPTWLLRDPLPLKVQADKPFYQGPLKLLTRAHRLEAAWWDPAGEEPVLRDYFIARSDSAGLLWIFRERLHAAQDRPQWFLHGLYA
jgi:protein ImuB